MSENNSVVWAAQNGDCELIKNFLDQGNSVDMKVHGSRTILHIAADFGRANIIEFMIKNGATINIQDEYGFTPLLNAIYENHIECVKILVQNGADIKLKTPDGRTYAQVCNNEEISKLVM